MQTSVTIGTRNIGPGHPAYIIAELSANHAQSFDKATSLIEAAKRCGADAVKLQTYTADTLTLDCNSEYFKIRGGTPWDGRTLHELYEKASTPWEWQPKLKRVAEELGLALFSSVFDDTAVDFLETLSVPAYKISSFEIVDLPLIRRAARTGKPLIISTGMATLDEIEAAVRAARGAGAEQLALLKCTSSYPSTPDQMNLRAIPYLAETFGVPVGLSDHTLGEAVPIVAVALGASIVEKHLTLSRAEGGPDSGFSLEPAEFAAMVNAVRTSEQSLGKVTFGTDEREAGMRAFRRSIFITKDLKAGSRLSPENLKIIRPGDGLPPSHFDEVIGRRVAKDVKRGTPLTWDLLE